VDDLIKTPIQCDKGSLLESVGNRRQVGFGFGNNGISFAGVYNKDDNSIVVNLLWPGPTPVDAVKNATINGVVESHLEGKCFNRESESHISCRAHYKNEEQKNEFFMSVEMNYEKLINRTEELKSLRKN